jgi:hypothetical protein
MGRNRKHQSAAMLFGPALKALLLCVLIGGAGVGYVWQKEQIDELGRQIGQRERRLGELRKQNEKWRIQLSVLSSQTWLEARVRELNLGLAQPTASQVWRLQEPGMPSASAPRELAAGDWGPAPVAAH